MNQKKAKSMRRMAREIAREGNDTAVRYKIVSHQPRKVMVGWKPIEKPAAEGVVEKTKAGIMGLFRRAWNGLKRLAGRDEPEQKPDPIEYEPDIRVVAPETIRLAGGIRYYLQRMKAAFRRFPSFASKVEVMRPDMPTRDPAGLRALVRQERARHLQALAAR